LAAPLSPVLAKLVLERAREEKLPIGLGDRLPLGERGADLLFDRLELREAVGQLANDRPPRRLVVGPRLEVAASLQASDHHPGEIEDPVRRGLHEELPAGRFSESGWRSSCSRTDAGSAATSAPMSAASRTWIG